ncbi:MAG: response regulator [Acidobacteriota bacterium]|nr:MAG: response regulator [Acidobacteriota bacterium]
MKKILIADYDPKNLTYLQTILAGKGFEVQTVNNGQDAVEHFQNWNPDLVIIEPMLPKLHGFEVCKRIKSGPRSDVPLIWCTKTYKGRKYRSEALQKYQAFEHLERPVTDDVLLKAVGRALGLDLLGPKPSRAKGAGASAEASAAAKTTGQVVHDVDRDALLREMRQIGRKEKKTREKEKPEAPELSPEEAANVTAQAMEDFLKPPKKRRKTDIKKAKASLKQTLKDLKKTRKKKDASPYGLKKGAEHLEERSFEPFQWEESPEEPEPQEESLPQAPGAQASEEQLLTSEDLFGDILAEETPPEFEYPSKAKPAAEDAQGAEEGEDLDEIAAEDEEGSFEEEVEELSESLGEAQPEEAPAEGEEGEDFEQEGTPSLDALDALEGAVEGEGLEEEIAARDELESDEADSSEEEIEELSESLEESHEEEAVIEGEDLGREGTPSLDALDALEGAIEGGNLPDELFTESEEEQDLEEAPSGEEFDEEEEEEEISEELEPAVSDEADSSPRVVELHDDEEEEAPALEAVDATEGMAEEEELPENAAEGEEEFPEKASAESESDEETEEYKTQALDAEHPEDQYATLSPEEMEESPVLEETSEEDSTDLEEKVSVQEEEEEKEEEEEQSVPVGEELPSLPGEDIAASEEETSASAPEEILDSKKDFSSEEEAIGSLDEVFDASEPAAREAPEEAEEGEVGDLEPFEAVEEEAEEAAEPPEKAEEERQVEAPAEEEVSKDSTAQIERDEFVEEMRKSMPPEEMWTGAEEEKVQEGASTEEDSSPLEIEPAEEMPQEEAAREEPAVEEAALETAESVELEGGEEISLADDEGSGKEEESSEEVNLHFTPEEDKQGPSLSEAEEEEPSLLMDEVATGEGEEKASAEEPVEEERQALAVSAEAVPSEAPKEEESEPTLADLAEVAARPRPSLSPRRRVKSGKILKIAASLVVVAALAVAGYLFRDAVSEKFFRFRDAVFDKVSRGVSEGLETIKETAPSPAPVSSEPLKNLEGVKKPQPLRTTTPLLPQDSEAPSGTQVFVSAHITVEGSVKEARTVHNPSDEPVLSRLAEAEVLTWTFTPAEKDGRKVAVWLTVPVPFARGE